MKKTFLQFGIAVLLAFILSSVSGTLYGQTCPSGMIGFWKMAENSGPTYYDSFSTFDAAAPASAPTQTAGASGRGQMFDKASGTYLTIPADAAFNWGVSSDFTIELWVKFSGTSASPRLFIARDDRPYTDMTWYIGDDQGDGRISWYLQGSNGINGSITTSSAYNNNQWHHVVASRNGIIGRNYLYVDGVLQNPGGSSLTSFGSLSSSNPLTMGNSLENGVSKYLFTGALDEVAIYNRVLDLPTEILPHYSNIIQYQIGYCDGDDPMFLTEPVTSATVGQTYVYDVDASGNTLPTYSLVEYPSSMSINSISGVITWTPMSMSANGHVVVRATNDKGFVDQEFNIFLAGLPECRNGLIQYWDFDAAGTAGYVDNIAGTTLTGGAPATVTGIAGKARQFNGVSDSLNVVDPPDPAFKFAGSFTWELWMKSDASPSEAMVMFGRDEDENSSEYFLGVYPSGSAALYLRDYPDLILHGSDPNTLEIADAGTVNVLDGAWHHIVATYNEGSGTVQLWVDKIKVAEATGEYFDDFGANEPFNVGCWDRLDAGPRYWYEGAIDELAFYNVALNQSQITDSYNNAIAGNSACTYNYAPLILSSPDSTVVQGSLYTYNVVATDINPNDVLTLSVVSKPDWLTGFSYTPGDSTAVVSGTPDNDDIGMSTITIRVSDGRVAVDQTFQVRVINANDPPSFTSTPVTSVDQDDTYSYTVQAEDPDEGDVLTYSTPVKPAWLTFDGGTLILSGTPANEDVGLNDVTLRVSDGTVEIDQEFQITVNNVNDPPEFTSDDPITIIKAGEAYLYQMDVSDPDPGDELTFTPENVPSWLTLTPASSTAILSGTPAMSNVGVHAVIIKVSDGTDDAVLGFSITVLDPTGVEEMDNLVNWVYPNPATDEVHFEFAETGDVLLKIMDVKGSVLKEVQARHADQLTLDISDLKSNIYFYSVSINNKTSIGKLVKE